MNNKDQTPGQDSTPSSYSAPLPLLPLLALAVLLPLVSGIFGHDPWTPDEPRVAATSKEMALSGNWIVPTLGSDPFVEQPPLFHILTGFSWRFLSPLLGDTGSMRFVVLLCGLGTVLLTTRVAYLLFGARVAALAALILATSPGFIIASHTLRVDAALLLFAVASIAAAIEAYCRDRPWLLAVAGLCAAAALLSKGPVAMAFIIPAVAPFVWQCIRSQRNARASAPPVGSTTSVPSARRWVLSHVAGILLALVPVAAWMIALKMSSETAWKAWFWDNQLGRFTGAAESLGHHHGAKPHYYVLSLLIAMAPWSLALIHWAHGVWRNRASRPWADTGFVSLAAWGFGALVLLTLPVTKRDIYLAPALPAFCIMAAAALESVPPAWFRWCLASWSGVLFLGATLAAISPALIRMDAFRSVPIPPETAAWLASWHPEHFASLALIAIAVLAVLFGRRLAPNPLFVPAVVIALSLSALLTVCTTAVDQDKNLRVPAERFAGAVPPHRQARACARFLTETDRGALSFHAGWRIPAIHTSEELLATLTGRHSRFDSVVTSLPLERIPELQGRNCRVAARGDLGDARRPRPLYWIVGDSRPRP